METNVAKLFMVLTDSHNRFIGQVHEYSHLDLMIKEYADSTSFKHCVDSLIDRTNTLREESND